MSDFFTGTGIDAKALREAADRLVAGVNELNATFAKMPPEDRAKIEPYRSQINERLEMLRNELNTDK
jgi:hypothetical protein